jgi:isopropylmalate/homocitrate/citramalate synthase
VIPETLVGNRRVIAFGDKSGPNSVRAKAKALGVKIEDTKIDKVVERLHAKLREVHRPITDDEFRVLVQAL